jgi:hypothetical protein
MYCVIEYTPYSKDQTIEVHGYNADVEVCRRWANVELAKKYDNLYQYIKEYSTEFTEHVCIKTRPVFEYVAVNLGTIEAADMHKIEERWAERGIKTVEDLVFDCTSSHVVPLIYNNIRHLALESMNADGIRLILNYLALHYKTEYGPRIDNRSSQVFAVVKIPELH